LELCTHLFYFKCLSVDGKVVLDGIK